MLFVTTAIKPLSDFTTPRRLICPISRHFFPEEQPEPPACWTTGLKKGSLFPVIDHFLSSAFGCFAPSPFLLASAAGFPGAGAETGAAGLTSFSACCFGACTGSLAAILATALAATAGFAVLACGLAVADAVGNGAATFSATGFALGAGTAVGFATALTGVTPAGAGCDAGALAGFKTRAGAGFVAGAPGAGFPVCGVPTPAKAALLSLVFCS